MLIIMLVIFLAYIGISILSKLGMIFMNERTIEQLYLDWIKNPDVYEGCDTQSIEAAVRECFVEGRDAGRYFLEGLARLGVGEYRSFLYPGGKNYKILLLQQAYAYSWKQVLEIYHPDKTFIMVWGMNGLTVMRVK